RGSVVVREFVARSVRVRPLRDGDRSPATRVALPTLDTLRVSRPRRGVPPTLHRESLPMCVPRTNVAAVQTRFAVVRIPLAVVRTPLAAAQIPIVVVQSQSVAFRTS